MAFLFSCQPYDHIVLTIILHYVVLIFITTPNILTSAPLKSTNYTTVKNITRKQSQQIFLPFKCFCFFSFLLCVFSSSFSSPGASILSLGWQTLSHSWHMDHSFDSTVTSDRSAYATARPENSRNVCLAMIIPLWTNNEFTGHGFRHNRWNGRCPRCIHWQKPWRKCHGKNWWYWKCLIEAVTVLKRRFLLQFKAMRNEIT